MFGVIPNKYRIYSEQIADKDRRYIGAILELRYGLMIPKRMRIAGMTFYLRNGQLVGRESSTHEKRSNTLPQFIQRQKMRHTTALWKMLRFCDVMFTKRRTGLSEFRVVSESVACGVCD